MSVQLYAKDSHYIYDEQPPGSLNFNQPLIFQDTVAKQSFVQKKENEKRVERLLQVRKQEYERSRVNLGIKAKTEQEQQEEEMLEEKKRIYLEKKMLLEELKRQRELSLREIGMAHRDAVEQAEIHKIGEIEEQNRQNSFNEFMREKSKEAWEWQQKEEQERNASMTEFIERRKKVLTEETNRTRSVVEEYREKQKNQSISEPEYHDYEEYDKTILRKNFYAKANIDYSSSHLHNPLVVSHKNDETEITAIRAAEKENFETTKRLEMANTSRDISFKKSVERGSKAYEKERNKQMLSEISQQLDKISKLENVKRISEGKSQPELLTKPAKKLTTEARKDKQAEIDFEDAFAPKPVKKTLAEQTKTRPLSSNKKNKKEPQSTQKKSAQVFFATEFPLRQSEKKQEHVIAEEREESDTEQEKAEERQSKVRDVSPTRQEKPREQRSATKSPSYYEDELSESHASQVDTLKDTVPQFFQNTFSMPTTDTRQQSASSQFHHPQSYSSPSGDAPQSSTLAELQARYLPGQQNSGSPPGADRDGAPFEQSTQFYTHKPQPPVVNEHMQHYQPDSGYNYWPYRATDLGPIAEQHRPYQPSSKYAVPEGDFQNQFEHMKASYKPETNERAQAPGTSEAQLEFNSDSIKNYIKEQEEFLKRLDDQKKKLREKIFEEEDKFVTSHKTQSPEQKKSNIQPKISKEEERAFYDRETRDRPLPEEFNSSADSEQIRQLKKRADDLLNKFMNPGSYSPNKEGTRFSPNRDRFDSRGEDRVESTNPTLRKSAIEHTRAYYPDPNSTKRGRTPEKQKTVTFYGVTSSPSELNYSVSDHERSDKKHKKGILKSEHRASAQQPNESDRHPKSETFEISWGEPSKKNQSLAEAFRANRRDLVEKFEQEKTQHAKADKQHKNVQRTKEEILRQRKEMMEYKGPKIVKIESSQSGTERSSKEQGSLVSQDSEFKGKNNDPAPELLDRLAFGKKAKVNKKEMHELTSKNFEQLPEVKKKKDEEKRKEEFKARKEKVKQLEQKLRTTTAKGK